MRLMNKDLGLVLETCDCRQGANAGHCGSFQMNVAEFQ